VKWRKNIFVTGPSRSGKSTVISRIVERLDKGATGFFTTEIRDGARRVGFSITTLQGNRGILAHQDLAAGPRLGKYRVNLEDLEKIAVPSMVPDSTMEIVVVDEVGKMECFSELFRKRLLQVLDSENVVLGSIALRGDNFIEKIKTRPDVQLLPLSEKTRDLLPKIILDKISAIWQEVNS